MTRASDIVVLEYSSDLYPKHRGSANHTRLFTKQRPIKSCRLFYIRQVILGSQDTYTRPPAVQGVGSCKTCTLGQYILGCYVLGGDVPLVWLYFGGGKDEYSYQSMASTARTRAMRAHGVPENPATMTAADVLNNYTDTV